MRRPIKAPIERLDARLDGIGHVLADRNMVVPAYQRPYSWTDEQILDLLRDLSDAIRDKDSEYFLGTIVLTKNNKGTHFVIDGQQRLATVSIIICAIRNYFHRVGDKERADGIHQGYLARKELRGLTETAHLKLIAADNHFYEKEILGQAPGPKGASRKKLNPSSHTRLENALRLVMDHVAAIENQTQEPAQLLLDWVDYIRDKAKVIVVEVNDEVGAYTIFEVLNVWKPYGAAVRESIDALELLKATQIRPLVLAILKHFEDDEVKRALPMLVCWTVRFLVVGRVGSGPLENGCSERAKEVTAGRIKTAKALYTASTGFLASDDEFEQAFRTARVSAHYLGRYYLKVLEHSATSGTTELVVNPNEEVVTLEHVMPQMREPHWRHVTPEQHKASLKRIGNLALLDKNLNEYAGNLAFSDKKKAFAKSKITLTRGIAGFSEWDPKTIDTRQAQLSKLAVQAWPLIPR
jgi:Protein of unknown function DUF262/Protein of unknown function (DUF1524)